MPTPYERYRKGAERALRELQERWGLQQQEWGRGMAEKRLGLEEEQLAETKRYHDIQARPDEPNTPFELWQEQNPNAPIGDWFKLNIQQQRPTAYAQNLVLQKQNRLRYINLRTKFDERGMFKGNPKEFAEYKVLEQEFGAQKQDDTEADIFSQWIKYVADYNKKSPEERGYVGAAMSWPEYRAQFNRGQGSTTSNQNLDKEIQERLNEVEEIKRDLAK